MMNNKKRIFVFGEIHSDTSSVAHIQKRIEEIKPNYLLHELLYRDECYTAAEIKRRLKECQEGGICDPRINKDLYELGLKYHINLVGIDLDDPTLQRLPLRKQFEMREKHMVESVSRALHLRGEPKIVIVVGDTHLRESHHVDLGISPLTQLLASQHHVLIERAPENIQEMR